MYGSGTMLIRRLRVQITSVDVCGVPPEGSLTSDVGVWQRGGVNDTRLDIQLFYYKFNLVIYTLQNNSGK